MTYINDNRRSSIADRLSTYIDKLKFSLALALQPATIHYSIDRSWYYITWGTNCPYHWLQVETLPGAVPDDKKHGQIDGYIQIQKDDGTLYHRRMLPFIFWKVRSGDEQRISTQDDLFRDYAVFECW